MNSFLGATRETLRKDMKAINSSNLLIIFVVICSIDDEIFHMISEISQLILLNFFWNLTFIFGHKSINMAVNNLITFCHLSIVHVYMNVHLEIVEKCQEEHLLI